MARQKGYGRLFLRGRVWYMRWRYCGRECTRSTGILNDSPESRTKAETVLDDALEVLRLRDKAARLEVIRNMIRSNEEELKDRLAGIRRDATLDSLERMFKDSAYRIDCSKEQLEVYCRYIKVLVERMGGALKISDVDARLAGMFAKEVSDGRSANTYNKYLNGLSIVWRAIQPSVGITMNPWDSIPRRKLDTNVRRALTQKEIDSVFAVAKGEVRRLFAIGLYTGLRLGDAVRFSWEDIKDGAIFIKTGKTGAKVAIPIHPKLAEAIGERGVQTGPVVPHLRQSYLTGGSSLISQRFRRLFTKCGIATSVKSGSGVARPNCGFHSLRHTFVSRCAEAGIPQSIIQALVGHSSARMTERYTHLSDAAFLEAFTSRV